MPRPGSIVLYSELHSPRFDGVEVSDLASGERPAIVNAVNELQGTVELTVFTPYGASVRHDVKRSAWRWPGPEVGVDAAERPEVQSAKPADPVTFPSHEAVTEAQDIGDDQAEAEEEGEKFPEPPAPEPA